MNTWNIGLLLLLGSCIALGIWIYLLPEPKPGNCGNSTWLWDKSCLYIQETKPDKSLVPPKGVKPFLIRFGKSVGAGPPLFVPIWYRFRYVNVLTGGYSDFSDWTSTPVMSGACCLPCDGSCPFEIGINSCTFNQPVIGVKKSDAKYAPTTPTTSGGFIYMNLHRYVGTVGEEKPPENPKDEIIGCLLAPSGSYFTFVDVLNNPCKHGCPLPDLCSSKPCDPTKC